MTRHAIIALLAILASQAVAYTSPTQIIRNDGGGVVSEYMRTVRAAIITGQRVEIEGSCDSACTLWLAVACVRPNARLGFHGPSSGLYGIGLPPAEHDRIALEMARFYPPQIARWFLAGPTKQVLGMTYISGATAIEMGAEKCR